MFTISCNCTFLSLHIFVEIKLELIPLSFYTSFESHFDTPPAPVPIRVNVYPQNNQGEWNSNDLAKACRVSIWSL